MLSNINIERYELNLHFSPIDIAKFHIKNSPYIWQVLFFYWTRISGWHQLVYY